MRIISALLFILVAGCGQPAAVVKPVAAKNVGQRLKVEIVEILQTARQIEVLRIADYGKSETKRFTVLANGPTLQGADASSLAGRLLQGETYQWGRGPKECKPMPGLALKISNGKQSVTVLMCLECDIFYFSLDEKQNVTVLDFDPSHEIFVKLAKEWFPNDDKIQSLKPKQ